MILLLIAGAVILVAGLAAIGFGVPVQEFSFGNTLILAGTVAACTGAILVGMSVVVRELKDGVRRLGLPASDTAGTQQSERHPPVEATVKDRPSHDQFSSNDRPGLNVPDIDFGMPAPSARPSDLSEPVEPDSTEAAPPARPKRNLLFASSSRKERERAAATKPTDSSDNEATVVPVAPPVSSPEAPGPSFDDAWPPSGRGRGDESPTRPRPPSTFDAPNNGAGTNRYPPARPAEQPPVTVLKSGIVDGMAYSLYSDGSIEAQMPEGMMRFASIDELRSHLDQRP